jgi:signal recognition particle subunit SRP19
MPTVEDYFDDDTDLPLPSSSKPRILPNTGVKGALLEEIHSDDEGGDLDYGRLAEQSRGIFGEGNVAPPPSMNQYAGGSAKGKEAARNDGGGAGPQINPNTPMGGFMGDMLKLQQAEEERMEKLKQQFGSVSVSDPGVYKE